MINSGWRTLIVEKPSELSLKESNVYTDSLKANGIPVCQIKNLIVTSTTGNLSIPLLNELSRNHVGVILCDNYRTPSCEIVNTGSHSSLAGRLFEQIHWDTSRKEYIWKRIVEQKIRNQRRLLEYIRSSVPAKLIEYENSVDLNDITNREGQAARIYFSDLFGNTFRRHTNDNTNSALNYGYTIIRTALDRIITGHGYNISLGINHCSTTNRFNLPCDVMEPFRPFVDEVVYKNMNRVLDWDYKKLLIDLLQITCMYGERIMSIENAMEMYFLDIIKYLSNGEYNIGEVDFDR